MVTHSGIMSFAVSALALAGALAVTSNAIRLRIGIVLLVIWGLCAIFAALFHTDPIPPRGPLSLSGTIHTIAANIGFFSLTGAILACSWHLRAIYGRSVWTRVITWLALASVISLILFLIAFVVAVTFGLFVHCKFWNSAGGILTIKWVSKQPIRSSQWHRKREFMATFKAFSTLSCAFCRPRNCQDSARRVPKFTATSRSLIILGCRHSESKIGLYLQLQRRAGNPSSVWSPTLPKRTFSLFPFYLQRLRKLKKRLRRSRKRVKGKRVKEQKVPTTTLSWMRWTRWKRKKSLSPYTRSRGKPG